MTRHRFDPFSALAGLLALALALTIGVRTGPIGLAELQLVGPVAILVLGVALLAAGSRPSAPVADLAPEEAAEPDAQTDEVTAEPDEVTSRPDGDDAQP